MPENTIALPGDSGSGSPFDAIRREDENGEYWAARDLQVVMGYEKWENFEAVIDRAIRSAENTATYSERAFSRSWEPVVTSGNAPNTQRANYRLSRYAAYLVAMNGDPNKPQVASAQAYFAIKTREAENATSKPLTELEMARKYLAALEREQQLNQELEIAKPKAGKWDAFCNSDGLIGMRELGDIMKVEVRVLTSWLVEISLFRRQVSRGGGGRNLPRTSSQQGGYFELKTETANGVSFPVAYATPRGVDLVVDLWGRRTDV